MPRHLRDLARYLTAIGRRLELLPRDVDVDRGRMLRVHAVAGRLRRAGPGAAARRGPRPRTCATSAGSIEELRVSLWAQQLGTPRPVSEKRIYRALDAIAPVSTGIAQGRRAAAWHCVAPRHVRSAASAAGRSAGTPRRARLCSSYGSRAVS